MKIKVEVPAFSTLDERFPVETTITINNIRHNRLNLVELVVNGSIVYVNPDMIKRAVDTASR